MVFSECDAFTVASGNLAYVEGILFVNKAYIKQNIDIAHAPRSFWKHPTSWDVRRLEQVYGVIHSSTALSPYMALLLVNPSSFGPTLLYATRVCLCCSDGVMRKTVIASIVYLG